MKLFRAIHRYKCENTVPLILKDDRTVMDIKKFQVTISFELDDEVNALIPKHRKYINTLINKEVIDHYAVSLESKKIWITISAEDKAAVDEYLSHSPLFKFWIYEVDEIFVLDGLTYRLPHLQLN